MDAPRLRSNPAAAGPERALRKEVTALADRLKALTAEEERAHAATLARFDDTDDDEDDGAVPPPPPPPPPGPLPARSKAASARSRRHRRGRSGGAAATAHRTGGEGARGSAFRTW